MREKSEDDRIIKSDAISSHSSSYVSVPPVYLDGGASRSSVSFPAGAEAFGAVGSPLITARSMITSITPSNPPFGTQDDYAEEGELGIRRKPSSRAISNNGEQGLIWTAFGRRAAGVIRLAAGGANKLLVRLLEPKNETDNSGNNERDETPALQVVHMDDAFYSYIPSNPTRIAAVRDIPENTVEYVEHEEEEEEEAEEEDLEPLRIQIDLASTLRAYRKNPNECFGHLVAAALSGRSAENPVTGEELKEARLNPYLVRMVIDSQNLNLEDPLVQSEVQRCVDSIIPSEAKQIPQGVYEYLPSLFKLKFVRLDSKQYTVMKDNGFEFVKLLCEYPHVLPPDRLNSIRLNYVQSTWYIDLVMMIMNMLTELFCIVSIALSLVYWMRTDRGSDYQRYGFYTAIIYGIGYAANLIGMIFLMRGKERDAVYNKMFSFFPSPHLHVLPVVPLYNFVSIITFTRYRLANKSRKYVTILHDIVAAQVLSSLCFALCIATPQFIYQTYIIADEIYVIRENNHHYSYLLLVISSITTCCIALLRLLRLLATYDSVNCFGFACFGFHRHRIIEKYSGILRMIFASCLFVFEVNAFFTVMGAASVSDCKSKVVGTITISGATVLLLLVVFAVLLLSNESIFGIMWSLIPLTILQIALLIHHQKIKADDCYFIMALQGDGFIFRAFIWSIYFFFLALWILQLILIFLMKKIRSFLR